MATDDRAQRWQKITIDQLGFALNLILTLTVAALGCLLSLLKDHAFLPSASAKLLMRASAGTIGTPGTP